MKSEMPYYGITAPELKKICRAAFSEHVFEDFKGWREAVETLWRGAKRREERYAALELAGHRRYRKVRNTMKSLELYETLVVEGAWWDLVDGVASHRLGELLESFPEAMKPKMRRWSKSDDLWKRRSAIICQLRRKEGTDLELLYDCIEPSLDAKDFFLRKAIGWALRQYAWTDPDEIVRYVEAHADQLSSLSKREALKNVGR